MADAEPWETVKGWRGDQGKTPIRRNDAGWQKALKLGADAVPAKGQPKEPPVKLISDIVSYTPCKLSAHYKEGMGYRYFFINEFFEKNKQYITQFLQGLTITGCHGKPNMERTTYTAVGSNNVLYVYSKKVKEDKEGVTKQVENTNICYLNKNMVEKIRTHMEPKYEPYLLDLMFDDNNEEKKRYDNSNLYLKTRDFIMMPNSILFFIGRELIQKYRDFKKAPVDPNLLKDIVFNVIVLPT